MGASATNGKVALWGQGCTPALGSYLAEGHIIHAVIAGGRLGQGHLSQAALEACLGAPGCAAARALGSRPAVLAATLEACGPAPALCCGFAGAAGGCGLALLGRRLQHRGQKGLQVQTYVIADLHPSIGNSHGVVWCDGHYDFIESHCGMVTDIQGLLLHKP